MTRPHVSRARQALRARRPGHENSTAHLQAAYPALASSGLGSRGIYIGRDTYGQAFCADPWELYDSRIITSPNMEILGQIGSRKSTLIKTMMWRGYLFGRYSWVIDVKREYGPLCEAIGGTTIALRPGGDVQLNPLTPLAGIEQQDRLLQAVAAAALGRDLLPHETTGLSAALDLVRDRRHSEPVLPDIVEMLLRPTADMAARLVTSVEQLTADVRTVALGLLRLCEGELRGMFDAPTSPTIDWGARMIVVDLADVADSRALVVLLTCATAAIRAQVVNRHRNAMLAQQPTPKTMSTVEEGWRILANEQISEAQQESSKLVRRYGECNVHVLHSVNDLLAVGAEGSRTVRLAQGLFSETEIRVVYKQSSDQLDSTRRQLGLSSVETALLPTLAPGVALWRVGRFRTIVQHRVSTIERRLVYTDEGMRVGNGRPR